MAGDTLLGDLLLCEISSVETLSRVPKQNKTQCACVCASESSRATESRHTPVPVTPAVDGVQTGPRASPRAHCARAPLKVKPTSVTLATCLANPGEPLTPPAQSGGLSQGEKDWWIC